MIKKIICWIIGHKRSRVIYDTDAMMREFTQQMISDGWVIKTRIYFDKCPRCGSNLA